MVLQVLVVLGFGVFVLFGLGFLFCLFVLGVCLVFCGLLWGFFFCLLFRWGLADGCVLFGFCVYVWVGLCCVRGFLVRFGVVIWCGLGGVFALFVVLGFIFGFVFVFCGCVLLFLCLCIGVCGVDWGFSGSSFGFRVRVFMCLFSGRVLLLLVLECVWGFWGLYFAFVVVGLGVCLCLCIFGLLRLIGWGGFGIFGGFDCACGVFFFVSFLLGAFLVWCLLFVVLWVGFWFLFVLLFICGVFAVACCFLWVAGVVGGWSVLFGCFAVVLLWVFYCLILWGLLYCWVWVYGGVLVVLVDVYSVWGFVAGWVCILFVFCLFVGGV